MAVQLEQECGRRQKGARTCGRSRGSKGKAVKAVAVSPIYMYIGVRHDPCPSNGLSTTVRLGVGIPYVSHT